MNLWNCYSGVLCELHIVSILEDVYGTAAMPPGLLDPCDAFLEYQLVL